jgi:16S rRNA G966 N2-methylase RsmD
MNKLYYGDNLDVLRKFVRDETVDLCYIDPPFNLRAQPQSDLQQHRAGRPRAGVCRYVDVGRPRQRMFRRDSDE